VEETIFAPSPRQTPRIPVWSAGCWPNRGPFRRAARWDGVFPTHAELGHADTIEPGRLQEIVRYTREHRDPGAKRLDVVVEGHTDGRDRAADRERVAALEDAGLTWWIEKLGWFHGPLDVTRRRITAGPPAS
jgi:hypothetical protein